jgi:hypothetical protein
VVRAVCCVQKDRCHETVHRRKRYGRVRYGDASTAKPRERAFQVGHLEQGSGTALAVN